MLFLARSAVCIGLVAAVASHVGAGGVATALDRGARQAADEAGRACLRSDACLRVGAAALAAAPAVPLRAVADPLPRPRAAAPLARRPGPRPGHVEPERA